MGNRRGYRVRFGQEQQVVHQLFHALGFGLGILNPLVLLRNGVVLV
ncbi:hypothetical protein SDC9_212960 [bioreactor metagenome]|uniref:Uncharacterized protein n=1 Tax=bioreactor metagenome TaxID=1076179 RepID=A0A645JNH7_9ZZZZ